MASASIEMLHRTSNKAESDECYTPKEAIMPLLEFLPKDKVYYECTSWFSSSIVDVMTEAGFRIQASKGEDFLNGRLDSSIEAVITNPPYSKKDRFIKKCYDLKLPFALLLPVSSIQGQARGKLFSKHGIELLVLNSRVDFTGGGSPHFGVAWFCHKILPQPLIFS